jgi:hypothetical protein
MAKTRIEAVEREPAYDPEKRHNEQHTAQQEQRERNERQTRRNQQKGTTPLDSFFEPAPRAFHLRRLA